MKVIPYITFERYASLRVDERGLRGVKLHDLLNKASFSNQLARAGTWLRVRRQTWMEVGKRRAKRVAWSPNQGASLRFRAFDFAPLTNEPNIAFLSREDHRVCQTFMRIQLGGVIHVLMATKLMLNRAPLMLTISMRAEYPR